MSKRHLDLVGLGTKIKNYKPPTWPPKIVTLWVIFRKIWPQLTKRDLEGQLCNHPSCKRFKHYPSPTPRFRTSQTWDISETKVANIFPVKIASCNNYCNWDASQTCCKKNRNTCLYGDLDLSGNNGLATIFSKTEVLPTVPIPVCSHNHSHHRQTATI